MHEYQAISRFVYSKLIQNRYNSMRCYFTDFIQLPFLAEKGINGLDKSIDLIRSLDRQETTKIPKNIDIRFMDAQLAIAMRDQKGEIKRNLWEMGVAVAIKDSDLYVEHSNKYASFWNLIYQDQEWEQEKHIIYQEFNITQDPEHAVGEVVKNFSSFN